MTNDIPWLLLEKYFAQATDQDENLRVKEWQKSAPENTMILEQLQYYFRATGSLPVHITPDVSMALEKITKRMSKAPSPERIRKISIWWKVAAMLILTFGGWWMVQRHMQTHELVFVTTMSGDTSANGLVLADGSHIWLNAGSYLRYPDKFGKTRDVILNGEAYFEIAHNPEKPFIVYTGKTQTRVLGTKFNIRSYPSEKHIAITVTEGKVRFGTSGTHQVILTRGQAGDLNKATGMVSGMQNNNPNFLAWKTKEFCFDQHSLGSVFEALANVYHFTYSFEQDDVKKIRLSTHFKQMPLTEIFRIIALTTNVTIAERNGMYFIKKS